MIFCEGGGEETFFKMLGKANKLAFDGDGKLLLLTDDIPIMRFKKSNKTVKSSHYIYSIMIKNKTLLVLFY